MEKDLIILQCVWPDPYMPAFTVLCRIDAFADYVALVKARNAEEAAQFAQDSHDDYKWEPDGAQEFDDRVYVTLDKDSVPIDATQVGDF